VAKRRRWPWIVGLSVGIPLLLIGGFLGWMAWQGRSDASPLETAEPRELPSEWLDASPTEDGPSDVASEPPAEEPSASVQTPSATAVADEAPPQRPDPLDDLPLDGVLAFVGDGRRFGGERYALERSADGSVILESSGAFEFRVVVATVRVPFEQRLELDDVLRPRRYRLDIDGVAGFGARNIEALVDGTTLRTTTGDDSTEAVVDPDATLILGTFSSYAVVPVLLATRGGEGPQTFDLLAFGGPPGEGNEGPSSITVTGVEPRTLRTDAFDLQVEAHRIVGGFGESLLFAKGTEFLGLLAGQEDEQLLIYRADYFPDGFDLVP
jgi:hypothetical protein